MFVAPLGEHAFGPGVNIGLPPRFAILSYAAWTVILAWQAIRLARISVPAPANCEVALT